MENWLSFHVSTLFLFFQFILPFIIILFCYVKVSIKLADRAKAKPGSKNSKKEAMERERKRRTNRMLIAMVMIFGICWLPINVLNLLNDVYPEAEGWKYYNLCFFISHAIAMSSCCYNRKCALIYDLVLLTSSAPMMHSEQESIPSTEEERLASNDEAERLS